MFWIFKKNKSPSRLGQGIEIWIVDIETTWFFDEWWLIVEVWIASLDLDSWVVSPILDLILRESSFSESNLNSWIFSNSTLTYEQVKKSPALSDVKDKIQNALDTFPIWLTAYNKEFDFTFLRDRGFYIAKELPCPMKIATPIVKLKWYWWNKYKRPKVEEARKYLIGTPYTEAHRGLDDAIHEAQIVHKLYEMWEFIV